jgi:glycosyltransferase involved in cell wall biosynthesis
MPQPLIYALHSGEMYGTEKMALATAQALKENYEPIFFAPSGKALDAAKNLGFAAYEFKSPVEFLFKIRHFIADNPSLTFIATGLVHSFACLWWSKIYRKKISHLHVIHGGAEENLSYGRKKLLNRTNVVFVAVSKYVKERLIVNGVNEEKIRVIENFLPDENILSTPKRPVFNERGIKKVLIVSRLDPLKKVDLLFDALDMIPQLRNLSFRVLGTGSDFESLKARATKFHRNVEFIGYNPNVSKELSETDLLLHLCPTEPFGLAILEAMAARLPVLVPDQGGSVSIVKNEVSGFMFKSNNSNSLALRLSEMSQISPEKLNKIAEIAYQEVKNRFSSSVKAVHYKELLNEIGG